VKGALTVFFAAHALSAALALGLPWVMAWAVRRSEKIAKGMTPIALVNLSVAVVMGVAALLFISRVHPRAFTGAVVGLFPAALAVLPLLSAAYASLYAYQLRGWNPGPLLAGLATLGIAAVFAALGAWSGAPGMALRLAHFIPASIAAAGIALMIRFAGETESRTGARLAFAATLIQAATGVSVLLGLPGRPSGNALWAPIGEAAGLLALLGFLSSGARVTRFTAWATAAAIFFVTLSMASLREGVRGGASGPPRTTSGGHARAGRIRDIPGMSSLARISPDLFLGSRPRAESWAFLRAMKIRTVIRLGGSADLPPDPHPPGIESVDLPLRGVDLGGPSPEELGKFFSIVLDPARRPVLFYGAGGEDPAGMMAAIYRIEVDGWRPEEAIEEMRESVGPGVSPGAIGWVKGYAARGLGKPR